MGLFASGLIGCCHEKWRGGNLNNDQKTKSRVSIGSIRASWIQKRENTETSAPLTAGKRQKSMNEPYNISNIKDSDGTSHFK